MAGEIEKINEIFRIHDEKKKQDDQEKQLKENTAPQEAPEAKKNSPSTGRQKISAVDKLFLDKEGDEVPNYTGDEVSERDYRPVRQSRESKSGCLGGVMYFVFVVCVSVILACVAWMAASDMLALNQGDFTATVTLPSSAFETETVDTFDEDGNKTGTERISRADIDFVASSLKEAGLIEYEWLFKFFCQISHADTKVTPGSYELKSTFDYRALVQNMQPGSGSAVTVKVTIPEGYSLNQIFRKLEENGVCSYDELVEAAANSNYKYSFLEGIEAGDMTRLEGYLFPDTYEFYVGMQASSAINKFLERFNYVFTADMLKQATDRGLSLQQVITVASLIEKEAAVDNEKGINERALVASVIYNRLSAGMPLGIDASILYLYPDHEGGPTAEMLALDSPYNTRLYTGLPPTPIGNPGLAAIQAALNPETTSYYYYALDTETNTHRFFTNDYEFNNFVATQNYG
ncbi:MAG: endolytic transglycosylase MltG [Clostridiales bacterium]|nr:endolytic transglycosylase MltG [Clostridiales bacterium]